MYYRRGWAKASAAAVRRNVAWRPTGPKGIFSMIRPVRLSSIASTCGVIRAS